LSVRGAYAGDGAAWGFLLLGADRVEGDGLAAARLLDLAEAELTLWNGDVDALEILVVPPATIVDAVNDKVCGGFFTAAVAPILVAVEDGARIGRGADEREGEDDVLEHLGCEGTNRFTTKQIDRRNAYARRRRDRIGLCHLCFTDVRQSFVY
jgi:hypothetical protein